MESNPKTYALISHESAVEAIWALAARNWKGVLDDENIWLIPASESCVKTQKDFKELETSVDLQSLGLSRKPIDLLVPDKACCSRGKMARFHVWSGSFPPNSFVRIHDRIFISTPFFAALQIALACRPGRLSKAQAAEAAEQDARLCIELGMEGEALSAEQLVQWENVSRFVRAARVLCDFMGTYRFIPDSSASGDWNIAYKTKPIIRPDALWTYLKEMGSIKGIARARDAANLAFSGSASPMETALALMLSAPYNMGGFGLPRPLLNHEIPSNYEEQDLVSQGTIIADLCWPDQRVVIEYYGWEDHFGAGPSKVASDAARANSLTTLGWTVLHVTFDQVRTLAGITLLARQLAHALGAQLPSPTALEQTFRTRLWTLLLPKLERFQ